MATLSLNALEEMVSLGFLQLIENSKNWLDLISLGANITITGEKIKLRRLANILSETYKGARFTQNYKEHLVEVDEYFIGIMREVNANLDWTDLLDYAQFITGANMFNETQIAGVLVNSLNAAKLDYEKMFALHCIKGWSMENYIINDIGTVSSLFEYDKVVVPMIGENITLRINQALNKVKRLRNQFFLGVDVEGMSGILFVSPQMMLNMHLGKMTNVTEAGSKLMEYGINKLFGGFGIVELSELGSISRFNWGPDGDYEFREVDGTVNKYTELDLSELSGVFVFNDSFGMVTKWNNMKATLDLTGNATLWVLTFNTDFYLKRREFIIPLFNKKPVLPSNEKIAKDKSLIAEKKRELQEKKSTLSADAVYESKKLIKKTEKTVFDSVQKAIIDWNSGKDSITFEIDKSHMPFEKEIKKDDSALKSEIKELKKQNAELQQAFADMEMPNIDKAIHEFLKKNNISLSDVKNIKITKEKNDIDNNN
jgi:hypothetical protein